jgi:MFS family permease
VNVCRALFGVASGLVIDRAGPRRVIVLSMLILGGGGVLGAGVSSASDLLASRFLEGLGLVGSIGIAITVLRKTNRDAKPSL